MIYKLTLILCQTFTEPTCNNHAPIDGHKRTKKKQLKIFIASHILDVKYVKIKKKCIKKLY